MANNSIKGFKVGNEVKKYDYDELDNLPENDPDDLAEEISDLKSDLHHYGEIIGTVNMLSKSINSPVNQAITIPCDIIKNDYIEISASNLSTSNSITIRTKNNGANVDIIFNGYPKTTSLNLATITTGSADSVVFYSSLGADFVVNISRYKDDSILSSLEEISSEITGKTTIIDADVTVPNDYVTSIPCDIISGDAITISSNNVDTVHQTTIKTKKNGSNIETLFDGVPSSSSLSLSFIATADADSIIIYSYSGAAFHVEITRDNSESLKHEMQLKEFVIPQTKYTNLLDYGTLTDTEGSTVKFNPDSIRIYSLSSHTYINLSDFTANSVFSSINNLVSAKSFDVHGTIFAHIHLESENVSNINQISISIRIPNTNDNVVRIATLYANDFVNGVCDTYKQISVPVDAKVGSAVMYIWQNTVGTLITGYLKIYSTEYIDGFSQNDINYMIYPKKTSPKYTARGNCKENGKLVKSGINIVNANSIPVELRGVGLHSILQYKNLHSWEAFNSLKSMGVNLIRCSVYLNDNSFAASDGETAKGYLLHKEETLEEIDYIVKNCIDLGLYVLLDWHHWADGDGTLSQYQEDAEEFFTILSSKYSTCDNVMYEITNEPFLDSVSDIVNFVNPIHSIITSNVENPIMVTGMTSGANIENWQVSCKNLYDALSADGMSDVFISPHIYGSSMTSGIASLISNGVPIFVTEWGNSSPTGDGVGNDNIAFDQINWLHLNCVPQCIWKFTDQTMVSSLLKNRGLINSQKYFFGFTEHDLSNNGQLLLGEYKSFITDKWIERSAT